MASIHCSCPGHLSNSSSREQQRAKQTLASEPAEGQDSPGKHGLDLVWGCLLALRPVLGSRGHWCSFLFRQEGERTQSLTTLVQTNQKPPKRLLLVLETNYFQMQTAHHPNIIWSWLARSECKSPTSNSMRFSNRSPLPHPIRGGNIRASFSWFHDYQHPLTLGLWEAFNKIQWFILN